MLATIARSYRLGAEARVLADKRYAVGNLRFIIPIDRASPARDFVDKRYVRPLQRISPKEELRSIA